ncbi:hypothetical protein AB0L40_00585 [Patulibacter sp. NPDC049589]|uniref:hypothetical protein n=1 Tax=Patulibacter sp. NPDC049589 TaxID=3154731 RepID=UPI00343AE39A
MALVIVAIVGLGVVAISDAAPRKPLKYKAWVAASAKSSGCLGRPGVYADLDTVVKPRIKLADEKRLAKRNKPTGVRLAIGSKTYRMKLDTATSVVSYGRIIWGLKPVHLKPKQAKALMGERASVSYKLGDKTYRTNGIKVVDGDCKPVF